MEIVCEMGVNWKTREQAYLMMGKAFALGIKFVKFQLFTKDMVPKDLQDMYIDKDQAEEFVEVGKNFGQDVFFSVMYPGAIDICEEIGVKYYKIRYMDRNNLILYRRLKKIKDFKDKIIFVSCQNPKDTIFWNIAKYQKNVRFLYCVPKYPAQFEQYNQFLGQLGFNGISDHTPDLKLYCLSNGVKNIDYFEMHVKLNDDCCESDWSKSFEDIKKAMEE